MEAFNRWRREKTKEQAEALAGAAGVGSVAGFDRFVPRVKVGYAETLMEKRERLAKKARDRLAQKSQPMTGRTVSVLLKMKGLKEKMFPNERGAARKEVLSIRRMTIRNPLNPVERSASPNLTSRKSDVAKVETGTSPRTERSEQVPSRESQRQPDLTRQVPPTQRQRGPQPHAQSPSRIPSRRLQVPPIPQRHPQRPGTHLPRPLQSSSSGFRPSLTSEVDTEDQARSH